jgi:hypothetical protein
MKDEEQTQDWDLIIKGNTTLFDINFSDLWRYRDLLGLFVKRDFISFYKQTILGPLWFFIQPIFTTISVLMDCQNICFIFLVSRHGTTFRTVLQKQVRFLGIMPVFLVKFIFPD